MTDETKREQLARRIWRERFGDMRGYPEGGPSFAHDEADAPRVFPPDSTSTEARR